MLVEYAHADDHEAWPTQETGHGRRGAHPAGETIPKHHRQVEHVRPGQKLAESVHLEKLLLREPVLSFDQLAPCEEDRAAETGQANPGKGEEQREPAYLWLV